MQSQMVLCVSRGGRDMFSTLLAFPLFIIIPPLFHTPLSPVPVTCTDQAAHYHILCHYVCGFFSDPGFVWLQSKEVK
jgi:hypothetical protein